jgi:hypothetical protein
VCSTGVGYLNTQKEEITTHLFGDCPKLEFFFGHEPIKDAHHKFLKIGLFPNSVMCGTSQIKFCRFFEIESFSCHFLTS